MYLQCKQNEDSLTVDDIINPTVTLGGTAEEAHFISCTGRLNVVGASLPHTVELLKRGGRGAGDAVNECLVEWSAVPTACDR